MKAICFLITLLFFLFTFCVDAQEWKVTWENQMGNQQMDYFSDVIEDQGGGYTVLGSLFKDDESLYNFWLIRLNENGDSIWTKTYGTTANDFPKKLLQDTDGGYVMLGVTEIAEATVPFLVKTDIEGKELWSKQIAAEGCIINDFIPLDGGYILVGSKTDNTGFDKLWIANLNSDSNIIWEKNPNEKFSGRCKSIKKLPNGGFVIASQVTDNGKPDDDICIMRTNEKFETVWDSRLRTPGLKAWPECICCSTDSCLMIVGWQGSSIGDINSANPVFDYDLILLKTDNKGKELFTKNFDREGSEGGNAIVIRPDGKVVVAGVKATSFLGKIGPWMTVFDNDGNLISENLIKQHFKDDQAIKVINSSDGGIVVIGPGVQDKSNSRANGWIMKFSSL